MTPALASVSIRAASRRGASRPMTVWPLRSLAASSADGFWTRRMASEVAYRSAVLTIVAPASVNAWSGISAPAPAPASTRTSSPAAVSLPSASGTRATRRSPAAVSLATPTFMASPSNWNRVCGRVDGTGTVLESRLQSPWAQDARGEPSVPGPQCRGGRAAGCRRGPGGGRGHVPADGHRCRAGRGGQPARRGARPRGPAPPADGGQGRARVAWSWASWRWPWGATRWSPPSSRRWPREPGWSARGRTCWCC